MNQLPVKQTCVHHTNHTNVCFWLLGRCFGAQRQAGSKACGIDSPDEQVPPAPFKVGQTSAICYFVVPQDSLSILKDNANSRSRHGLGCLISSRNPRDFPTNWYPYEALGLGISEAQGGMTGKLHIFYYLDIPF